MGGKQSYHRVRGSICRAGCDDSHLFSLFSTSDKDKMRGNEIVFLYNMYSFLLLSLLLLYLYICGSIAHQAPLPTPQGGGIMITIITGVHTHFAPELGLVRGHSVIITLFSWPKSQFRWQFSQDENQLNNIKKGSERNERKTLANRKRSEQEIWH